MTHSRDVTHEILRPSVVHGGASVVGKSPLHVVTSAAQWAYALSYSVRTDAPAAAEVDESGARVVVKLSILRGTVGVGITTKAGDAFITETFMSDAQGETSLLIPPRVPAGALVLRNAHASGDSEFVVTDVRVESLQGTFRYPVYATPREFAREPVPVDGDSRTVFDTEAARLINAARLDWLSASGLVGTGLRILDAGAGVGHFLPFYLERRCTVVALEGREDNVAELRGRYPTVEAHVADVQRFDVDSLGRFDVIHSFGLLYHLESPIAALRLFRKACRGMLILETMVCDSTLPVCVIADETKAASQALDGLGSRPSPAFVALALNRVGFRYVYGAHPPPHHEDFQFSWQNNLDTVRDNHPLRCVFVASDVSLDDAPLVRMID